MCYLSEQGREPAEVPLAAFLGRGVKDGGGWGIVGEENYIMLHIYSAQTMVEKKKELHNSQCASFCKTPAEILENFCPH